MPSDQAFQRTAHWVQAQQHSQSRASKQNMAAYRDTQYPSTATSPPSPQTLRRDAFMRTTPLSSQTSLTKSRERSSSVMGAGEGTSMQGTYPASSAMGSTPNQTRHRGNSTTRPYIPTVVYQHPNLPAFVQGPPGSGYPMMMTPVQPPYASQLAPQKTTMMSRVPSPPAHIPVPMNPKKSRPITQKRRPSLSGAVFEPPPPQHVENHSHSRSYKDLAMAAPDQRSRRRAHSESRR